MTLYGYRYKPGGMVIELPDCGYLGAVDMVIERRNEQRRRHNPPTAELVEREGDEWRAVPLPGFADEAVVQ